MQIIFRFLLLAATLCSTVDAVEPYTPHHSNPLLEPWRWRSFPKIGGQELQCLAEDRDGNLWFGTQDGIWRYDGLEWTRFGVNQGLDGTPVVAIVVSPSNTIFCASGLGIYAFSGNEWTRTFPLTGDMTWFFEDLVIGKSGSLWAASAWGVLHLQNESSTLYCLDEVGRAFRETFPSLDYVALPAHLATTETLDYAGLGLERSGDTVFGVIPGSPADSADIHLGDRLIAVDTVDGDRHLTIHRQRVEAPIQLDIHPRRGRGDLRHFSANDVCLSRDGTVWVAVSSGEIVHFAPATNIWRKYGKQDGLSIGELVNLLESTEGTIWAVSDDRERGINRFDGSRWSTLWLSAEGGIDLNPSILETQDGTIWVGGHEGILHAYREEKWEVYRSPEVPLPTTRIVGLLESSDGALWMAGRGREPIRFDASTQRWMTCNNLNFACEDAEGGKWFLEVSGKVVRMLNDVWTSYGRSDGLMDTPTGLITASNGDVWAVGSHDHQAASAQLTNGSWQLKTYPELSWGVDGRAVLAAKGGDVWLGAAVDWDASQGRQGGILRVDGNTVDHYRPLEVEVLRYVYGIGQTADGLIWIGSRRGLHHFDGQAWERVYEPEVLTSRIDVVHSSDTGDLWLGHRSRGVFHRTPAGWDQTDAEHGLADNTVRAILKTRDQSVWAVSDRGTSRFDGQTWTTPALPPELRLGPRGSLRETSDGTLWINTASETWHRRAWPLARPDRARPAIFKTVRHRPDPNTPETTIAFAQAEVSQPGNTTISWTGADPWGETQNVDLQFAWKLDDRPWSPYSSETNQIFQELGSGRHRFEVRARDQNFNVDLTPASVVFLVTPPVWQQAWFIALVVLFSIGVTLQTVRVVGRERALHRSNEALQESNSELARSNRELEETRDQLVMSEKMASLGNLVAGVAHEINNPMGAFNSAADTLKRCIERVTEIVDGSRSSDEIRKNRQYQRAVQLLIVITDNAVIAGGRVTRIVESLKKFAHLDEADYQQADLHESLDSIITLKEHELGDRISIRKSYGDIPLVACYASELNQVFMNVFNNAVESIEDRGEITISTVLGKGEVTLSMTDTGKGIPKDNLT